MLCRLYIDVILMLWICYMRQMFIDMFVEQFMKIFDCSGPIGLNLRYVTTIFVMINYDGEFYSPP